MRRSCASSTSLSRPKPTESSSRTRSRRLEMESDAVDDHDVLRVSWSSLRSTTAAGSAFLPVEPAGGFLRAVRRVQSSHAQVDKPYLTEGFRPVGYPHLVWPACRSGLPGCGRCACYSFLEPQVRVGCQVGTKGGRTAHGGTRHVPHQRCYPSLNTP